MEAGAENNTIDVICKQCLDVSPHISGVWKPRLGADVKGRYTFVPVLLQFGLDDLCLILGIGERSATDWD